MARLSTFIAGVLACVMFAQLASAALSTCRSETSYDSHARRGKHGGMCYRRNRCANGYECCATSSSHGLRQVCQTTNECETDLGFILNDAGAEPKCVKFVPKSEPYVTALFDCIFNGMTLLSLRSQAEVDWLQKTRREHPEYDAELYLGAQVEKANDVKWISQHYVASTTVHYTNWAPSEPKCLIYDECSLVSRRDGKWAMINHKELRQYACEKLLEA